jgi:hemoglobin
MKESVVMSDDQDTLYSRIGGEGAIVSLIDKFYGRVLNDPDLREFFTNSSIEQLKKIQREFFAAALDGPVKYAGNDLSHIHQGRGIQRKHFRLFVNHLIRVLEEEHLISRRDAMDIVFRIATYFEQITGDAGGVDG